jgi:hypothetical protein
VAPLDKPVKAGIYGPVFPLDLPMARPNAPFTNRFSSFVHSRKNQTDVRLFLLPKMTFQSGQTFRLLTFTLFLFSCKKEQTTGANPPPPPDPVKKVLLKDITIPHLPSPYYHFEYNADSTVNKVDFASGYFIYNVFYSGSKISEMRNNIQVNQDTLRYIYNNAGKPGIIIFIDKTNLIYRHILFAYNGDQVKEIDWDHKEDRGYLIDRILKFTYFPDGNLKTIYERRPGFSGLPEINDTTVYEQYDDKINVDDFSLLHDGIHDHLFLLQGFRLQKNNPGKETFTGGTGQISYTIDYTYTYNSDHTPSTKTGDFLYTAGSDSGKRVQVNTAYTYY